MLRFSELQNIRYINLDSRVDRKQHIENEFKKIGWKDYKRFPAIKTKHGIVGCGESHLQVLKDARDQGLEYVVVTEDDIQFLDHELYEKLFNQFMDLRIDFDVLLISGNMWESPRYINPYTVKTTKCVTTGGYLIKSHYFDALIDNLEQGLEKLRLNPLDRTNSLDHYWISLQETGNWYILYPRTVTQLPSHSDIQGGSVNYRQFCVDI